MTPKQVVQGGVAEKVVPVNGWEDFYEVSNYGYVRSKTTGKKLSVNKNNKGYCLVFYSVRCKRRINKQLHRVVAEHFIPNPENKPTVNHEDADKTNNAVWNLSWATHQEQITHAMQSGIRITAKSYSVGDRHILDNTRYDTFFNDGLYKIKALIKPVGERSKILLIDLKQKVVVKTFLYKMHTNPTKEDALAKATQYVSALSKL